jgi:DNA-binding CsgD family transcriptional regulator
MRPTKRERQVILMLSQGVTNKQIARPLRLAEGTVKVDLHRIYRKLGIANRTTLAVLAHTGKYRRKHSDSFNHGAREAPGRAFAEMPWDIDARNRKIELAPPATHTQICVDWVSMIWYVVLG